MTDPDILPTTVLDDFEKIPQHLTLCLSMLVDWRQRCENELECTKEGSVPKAAVASQMDRLFKSSISMAKELREWQKKRKAVVNSMNLEDKLIVALRLIQGLSVGDRLAFYKKVNEVERARQDGGIKLAVTHV